MTEKQILDNYIAACNFSCEERKEEAIRTMTLHLEAILEDSDTVYIGCKDGFLITYNKYSDFFDFACTRGTQVVTAFQKGYAREFGKEACIRQAYKVMDTTAKKYLEVIKSERQKQMV
ncbi:MAG: hypothetical protein GY739_21800 [Mesoflavibacter sp.]|nr:hypothetical protein [Mesoflavibacter sp.]